MSETELQPGERVIELAASVRTASLVAGIASGAITGWVSQHNIAISAITALGGGVVGYIIGVCIGRIIFPATLGNVAVVKIGISSLPLTIKGGISGAIIASILVSVFACLIIGNPIMPGVWPSLTAGIIIGIVFPCLLSLL